MNEKNKSLFDELFSSYKAIISNIAIIGYSEADIISRGANISTSLNLTCLFSYPFPDETCYNQMTYDMMFPDGNYNIECPKFFQLGLTNELGERIYLYCLKFSEKYNFENKFININKINDNEDEDTNDDNNNEILVPLVICIKSQKSDLESFKELLTAINQIIICDNINNDILKINNYKKVELLNIFFFLFSLPHTPPHSLVRLKLNNELCQIGNEIDFYFSSNCEIPCNKNDTDINLLFLILDQSIIIKVIIAILAEKQIIFRASKVYILHLIIPSMLKLIFPFKWQQTSVTIIPNEEVKNYLDAPGSYIIGILSTALEINEIIEKYPGKIIVDCDTNEIFGEEENIPFNPEKEKNLEENLSMNFFRKKTIKEKDKYSNIEGGIKQGKNIFVVDGSYIYQYDPENDKGKGKKMKFEEKNNIIIDTQNSQLLVHKLNDLINSNEIKWLRKNIQLVRNPEIFDIENISNKNHKQKNNNLKEDNSPILPNRPFSYNIQNIFMNFYLNKISDEQSNFMLFFQNTNLYSSYLHTKKYQNDSGKNIIENIKETKNNQRSIENCFIVEFNKKIFSALEFIYYLNAKMNEEKIKKDKYEIYEEIKKILKDYCDVIDISDNKANINKKNNFNNNNEIFELDGNNYKTVLKKTKNYKKGHVKSNHSLLQFNLNQSTNFFLSGIDKFSKNYFKFYKNDGFLFFINNMTEIFKEEGKDLCDIAKNEIFQELLNKYKTLDNLFKEQKEENNEIIIEVLNENFEEKDNNIINDNNNTNGSQNSEGYSDLKNSLDIPNKKLLEEIKSSVSERKLSMIDENEEEIYDSFKENSEKSNNSKNNNNKFNKDGEDLGNIILNGIQTQLGENYLNNESQNEINLNLNTFNTFNNSNLNINNSYNIINFPEFDTDNYIKNHSSNNNLAQYYLFLAFYLEEISQTESLLNKFNKEIKDFLGIKINVYKLILKLYKEAYRYSGEKHRDFPYFSFYKFLESLDDKSMSKLGKNLTNEDNFDISELLEIYITIMKKRNIKVSTQPENYQQFLASKKRASSTNVYDYYIDNNYFKENEKIKINNDNNNNDNNNNDNKNSMIKEEKQKPEKIPNFMSKSLSINQAISMDINDSFKKIIVNDDFKPFFNPHSPHILNEFCTLMDSCFPSNEDIKTKSVDQIMDEVHININSQTLIELLGELKKIKLTDLKTEVSKLCFWLNCFNFLLLFTIFYLKPNIFVRKTWEDLFKNIFYNIGGNPYSFEDMLYILFEKNIFFQKSKYSSKVYVKNNIIKLSKDKNISKDLVFITPLLLYIPTKEFFKPIIYEDNEELKDEIMTRISNTLLYEIRWEENNKTLNLSELMIIQDTNFLGKGYSKYKPFIREDIYKILKGKKYKRAAIRQMKWELCFDNLLEYTSDD